MMRDLLSHLLLARHPRLYGPRLDKDDRWPFYSCGFQHGDGWFGLIDALSFVVGSRVVERDLRFSIMQVKEKFGTLRFYADDLDDFCRGARAFAGDMSGRLCEISGRPGLPSRVGRRFRTLARGVDRAAEIWPESEPIERFIGGCGPANAIAVVRATWPGTLIDVPAGHADVADVLIEFLTADEITAPPPSAILAYLGQATDRRLIVDMSELDDRRLGGIAVAARLVSIWIDPLTGDTGPVNDLGRPAWAAT